MTPANPLFPRRPRASFVGVWGLFAVISSLVFAADPVLKQFDLPADTADRALKQFSEQAGLEVIFSTRMAREVRTHTVNGEMTARQAIDQMLANTGLVVIQDEKTGALTVRREERDPPAQSGPGPAAETGTSVKVPASDQLVTLNPFEVQEDSDKSYGALNSNSITAFNTELDKLPISADIFDKTFMQDIEETNSVEQMIQTYSAGAGYNSSTPGLDAPIQGPQDRTSGIGLRGLSTGVTRRDGFMQLQSTGTGVSSTFDIDRVEIINGPQALLYGNGGAGGVVNLISKEARLGQPAAGSLEYEVDQYGHKLAQLDYGMGTDLAAVRVAILEQDWGGRPQWLGGPLHGDYLQGAVRILGNTVVRLTAEQSVFNRNANNQSLIVTAASTANDARNGQALNYLFATHQVQASSNGGPSGMGNIDNGFLNFGNEPAVDGDWGLETSVNNWATLSVQTQWSKWLSTNFDAGYDSDDVPRMNSANFTAILAPNVSTNPTGTWALADTGSLSVQNQFIGDRVKGFRGTALLTNDIFDFGHSQTIFGSDFSRSTSSDQSYSYYQADSNWNVILGPNTSTHNGRTLLPSIYIPIPNGPIHYPYWAPMANRITYGGVNYVLQISNEVDPNLISPADPEGVSATGKGNYSVQTIIDKGLFAVNDSEWFNGRVETLVGARLTDDYDVTLNQGAPPQNVLLSRDTSLSYNAGINYKLLNWLRPYISMSDSYNPPTAGHGDPYGNYLGTSHGIGEEVGLKIANPAGTVSGSIAFYSVNSKNEQFAATVQLLNDINPSGLNGRYGAAPSVWTNVNRQSKGVQLGMTATPTNNWRMRLSAAYINGTIGNTSSWNVVYNDQFHENSSGQVTYADGTVVYVPATFNSKQLTVTSTTAGAMPLTVALMSSSSSQYFANPIAVSGQISSSSPAAKVLDVIDPVHGAILTGATGLPISQIQINPGFTPPTSIPLVSAGDDTVGYPEFSMNFTNMYTFSSGWMKGIRIGGTIALSSPYRNYYYFPNGVSPGATAALFTKPDLNRFDLIFGYEHKFKRITWSTQVNIDNVFNHYDIVILPDPVAGYSGGEDDATYNQQPRIYSWTNRISF